MTLSRRGHRDDRLIASLWLQVTLSRPAKWFPWLVGCIGMVLRCLTCQLIPRLGSLGGNKQCEAWISSSLDYAYHPLGPGHWTNQPASRTKHWYILFPTSTSERHHQKYSECLSNSSKLIACSLSLSSKFLQAKWLLAYPVCSRKRYDAGTIATETRGHASAPFPPKPQAFRRWRGSPLNIFLTAPSAARWARVVLWGRGRKGG
jgi:hypothetical protein